MKIVKEGATSTKCNGFWKDFILGAWSCNKVQLGSPTVKKRLSVSAVSNTNNNTDKQNKKSC